MKRFGVLPKGDSLNLSNGRIYFLRLFGLAIVVTFGRERIPAQVPELEL